MWRPCPIKPHIISNGVHTHEMGGKAPCSHISRLAVCVSILSTCELSISRQIIVRLFDNYRSSFYFPTRSWYFFFFFFFFLHIYSAHNKQAQLILCEVGQRLQRASFTPLGQSAAPSPPVASDRPLSREMKISVVSNKLWCVHKQLLLLLVPLLLLPLLFTLPEKVRHL